jgi:hypothetical protein
MIQKTHAEKARTTDTHHVRSGSTRNEATIMITTLAETLMKKVRTIKNRKKAKIANIAKKSTMRLTLSRH